MQTAVCKSNTTPERDPLANVVITINERAGNERILKPSIQPIGVKVM